MTPISLVDVSKYYLRQPTLWDRFHGKLFQSDTSSREKWCLRDITFDINAGERVGIIGENGAGKTSLLKLIAGLSAPSIGRVDVQGTVNAVLSLDTEFNAELTGYENIFHHFELRGYDRERINQLTDEIIEFSGLSEHIYRQFKTYSNGMKARLAFSCVTAIVPDVLLIDETLSVGDAGFVNKCKQRISNMIHSGTTVMVVSHDLTAIEEICERVIWLHHGELKADGPSEDVIANYKHFVSVNSRRSDVKSDGTYSGAEFKNAGKAIEISISDGVGANDDEVLSFENVKVRVRWLNFDELKAVSIKFELRRLWGDVLIRSHQEVPKMPVPSKGMDLSLEISLGQLSLSEGMYQLRFAAIDSTNNLVGSAVKDFTVKMPFADLDQPIWYGLSK